MYRHMYIYHVPTPSGMHSYPPTDWGSGRVWCYRHMYIYHVPTPSGMHSYPSTDWGSGRVWSAYVSRRLEYEKINIKTLDLDPSEPNRKRDPNTKLDTPLALDVSTYIIYCLSKAWLLTMIQGVLSSFTWDSLYENWTRLLWHAVLM